MKYLTKKIGWLGTLSFLMCLYEAATLPKCFADLPKTKVAPAENSSDYSYGDWRKTCRFSMGVSAGASKYPDKETRLVVNMGDLELGCHNFNVKTPLLTEAFGKRQDLLKFSGEISGPEIELTPHLTLKTPKLSAATEQTPYGENRTNVVEPAALHVEGAAKLSRSVAIGVDASAGAGLTKETNSESGETRRPLTVFGETNLHVPLVINLGDDRTLTLAGGVRAIISHDFDNRIDLPAIQGGLEGQEEILYQSSQKTLGGFTQTFWAGITATHAIKGVGTKGAFYDHRGGNPATIMFSVGALE